MTLVACESLVIIKKKKRQSAIYYFYRFMIFVYRTTFFFTLEQPDAPREVQIAETGSRVVRLSWEPPFSGNSLITQYILHIRENGEILISVLT